MDVRALAAEQIGDDLVLPWLQAETLARQRPFNVTAELLNEESGPIGLPMVEPVASI